VFLLLAGKGMSGSATGKTTRVSKRNEEKKDRNWPVETVEQL
jgi:hypothetical protein